MTHRTQESGYADSYSLLQQKQPSLQSAKANREETRRRGARFHLSPFWGAAWRASISFFQDDAGQHMRDAASRWDTASRATLLGPPAQVPSGLGLTGTERPHYPSASTSSWDQTDTAGRKAPPWLTVSINYLVYFKALSKQRHSCEAGYSRSFGYHSGAAQGQTYLWNVQGLKKPGLLSQAFTTHVKAMLSSRAMDWIWLEAPVLRSCKLHFFPPIISNTAGRSLICIDNIAWEQWQVPSFRNKYKKLEIGTYVTLFKRKSIYNANH